MIVLQDETALGGSGSAGVQPERPVARGLQDASGSVPSFGWNRAVFDLGAPKLFGDSPLKKCLPHLAYRRFF
jgi:hypothetical protein